MQEELDHERRSSKSGHVKQSNDFQKHLDGGHRTACLRAAVAMLQKGAHVRGDHLEQLLEQAALRPGATQFAMILWLVSTRSGVTIGVEAFLRGLGTLIQQDAPAQQIRLWLNLGIPKTSKALALLPQGWDQQEVAEATRELEEAGTVLTEDEDDGSARATKRLLCFTGCLARPELNGRYRLNEELTSHHKPVYEKLIEQEQNGDDAGERRGKGGRGKSAGKGREVAASAAMYADDGEDAGERKDIIVIHFQKKQGKEAGWRFSRKTCSGEELAFTGRDTPAPPSSGWLCAQKGARTPDPLRIFDARSASAVGSDALRVMSQIDVERLKGRLYTPDRSEHAVEYFGHFCALMHLEHLEELRQLRRRARRSAPELDGMECVAVFGRKDGRKANALGWQDPGSEMATFVLPERANLERLRIKKGDSVNMSESGSTAGLGSLHGKLEGTVADLKVARGREPPQMVVKLRGAWPDNSMSTSWRADQGANGTLYERQLQALLSLTVNARSKVCQLLIAARVGGVDAWVAKWQNKGAAGRLAPVQPATKARLKDRAAAVGIARAEPPGGDATKLREALEEVKTLQQLNASQRDAVRAAITQTCSVIQGPPGTGKTHVSVQILKTWSRTLGLKPLLATSDSNVAVDNIAMGLVAQGVKALRVGRPEKVNQIINEISLEAALDREVQREVAEMAAMEKEKNGGRSPSPESEDEDVAGGKGKGKKRDGGKGLTPKRRYDLQMKVLREAEVICCTSIAAGGDFFSKFSFAAILIDEAAQATELSAIVPVILRGTHRLVLVGDQCQLPPTVQSREAEERGLSVSLYSRMVDGGGIQPHLLDTQYRSHPLLAAFSARAFYQGKLRSGIEADERPPPRGPRWPRKGVPLAFLEVDGQEGQDGDSKMNSSEADAIVALLRDVFAAGELGVRDVGVVTPYVAQVRHLRRMARSAVPRDEDPMLLEIASVDNFQGREKELIIFSAVRSNPSGAVGFLADWRRLNVMITRARRGLVVCGNSRTLRSNEHWAAWLDFYRCAAAGEPLPRTPSPERRRREVEADEEKRQIEKELAETEAEASAQAHDRERWDRHMTKRSPVRQAPQLAKPRLLSQAPTGPRDTRSMAARLADGEISDDDKGLLNPGETTTGGNIVILEEKEEAADEHAVVDVVEVDDRGGCTEILESD